MSTELKKGFLPVHTLRDLANANVYWEYLRKESCKNYFTDSFDHKPVSTVHAS